MKKNILIAVAAVTLSVIVSCSVTDRVISKKYESNREITELKQEISQNRAPERPAVSAAALAGGTFFSDAAESAVNSVVYVKVVKRAQISPNASIFDLLFGFVQTPKDQVGIGSGVIISEDGYIVTNNHVVSGADEVHVTLYDNKEYIARLVGADPATDLALLKVDAEQSMPSISMGDSDALRLGEWVLAIGSPYDLRSTITAGIVSAKGRVLPEYDGAYRVESFIQTDAAVNPGNSGGALVNIAGELVGINTSIISLTGSYTGYSFAVPVNLVKRITDDLIAYGEVRRAMLGVSIEDQPRGAVIAMVQNGSPAEKAGLRKGDIIKEVNLNTVQNAQQVRFQIGRLHPGEKAVVTIERDNISKEIMVDL